MNCVGYLNPVHRMMILQAEQWDGVCVCVCVDTACGPGLGCYCVELGVRT